MDRVTRIMNQNFKFFLRFTFYVSCFAILDQITKLIFSHRDFLFGPLHLHPVKNFGLSFALNFGSILNIIFVFFALGFFLYYFWTKKDTLTNWEKVGFILIFAGAISNTLDRVALGYVRDFLDLNLGFTFNLADLFVTSGLVLIFLL